jgi:predicted RNA-binding Zn-ribbon protein involved in translation (DUF1610 family)
MGYVWNESGTNISAITCEGGKMPHETQLLKNTTYNPCPNCGTERVVIRAVMGRLLDLMTVMRQRQLLLMAPELNPIMDDLIESIGRLRHQQ